MQWLVEHPEFISNPFYVSGDSYSGITVPAITYEILEGIYSYLFIYLFNLIPYQLQMW